MRISRSIAVARTARVKQMSGLFDVAPAATSEQTWDVDLQLPPEWNVGVIVGPSGSGKSTIAAELFAGQLVSAWPWPENQSILDGFPAKLGIKEITGILSSVGFSSPPAWLRPFRVLSNGQQFRCHLARTLAEMPELAVVDEFTSVVDRTVAKIGSAAVAKTVRRRGQKFVAVTCHYDVVDWLEPDWVYDAVAGQVAGRGLVRRPPQRPPLELEIVRVDRSAWRLFKPHHYLSGNLHDASKCFVALVEGQPAAFTAVLSFPHPHRPGWREHRAVCLPDFQGIGIGNRLSEFVASLFRGTGKPYFSCTSHPAMIRRRMTSPLWRMTRAPSLGKVHSRGKTGMRDTGSADRITAGFEYVGPADETASRGFGVLAGVARG